MRWIGSRLQLKIWLGVGLVTLFGFLLLETVHYRSIRHSVTAEARQDAQTLYGVLMATRRIYHQQFIDSGLPLDERTLGFLPAHALSRISQDLEHWTPSGIAFANVARLPRNPDHRAEAAEGEAIRYFEHHPEAAEWMHRRRGPDGAEYFQYARPIWVETYCLGCHGPREQAPPAIRAGYDTAFDLQAGDLYGVLSIRLPAAPIQGRALAQWRRSALNHGLIYLLLLITGGLLVQRLAVRKVHLLHRGASKLAAGDYAARVELGGEDELASLAGVFNRLAERIGLRDRRLQDAQSYAQMGLFSFDPLSRTVTWAEESQRQFGLGECRSVDLHTHLDWIHPEDRTAVQAAIESSLRGGLEHNLDYRFRPPQGPQRWVNCRARPIRDADGKLLRLEGFLQDITQRKAVEASLRASEERFALAMRGAHDGLFDWDLKAQSIYYSPGWKSMLGYAEDELEDRLDTWERLVAPEDMQRSWRMLRDYAAGQRDDFSTEFRMRHKHGHWVDILSRAYMVRDDAGEPSRIVGTHTDISERKRAQQQIEAERNRARHYLDIAGVILIALDRQGAVQLINRKGCEILGLTEGEIIGRDWFSAFLPPEALGQVREVFASLMAGAVAAVEHIEGDIVTAQGERRTIAWRNSVIHDADGAAISGILSSGEDVTERNRALQAARDERSFLQHVIDGIEDPILVIGPQYQVLRMNRAAREKALAVNGASGAQALQCYALAHQKDAPCRAPDTPCPRDQVLREGRSVRLLHKPPLRDADGPERRRTFEVAASPLLDDQGRIAAMIEVSRDITEYLSLLDELKERELSYAYLAQHDALTGLPNRILLADRLTQALNAARRRAGRAALLLVDLDGFKHINDSFDHGFGDQVLQQVAQRFKDLLREEDTIARMGGDEFALILPQVQVSEYASLVARKLLAALEAPFEVRTQRVFVGASIGIGIFPEHGGRVDDLIRNADAAMYQAKAGGRNTFRYYSAEMTDRAFERVQLEASLRSALERDELVLYYQPQFDIASRRVTGFEALIRWRHPEQGLISPLRFIPLAEESGLIVPMGEWILRQACTRLKTLKAAGLAGEEALMCVNLSPKQFDQPDLAARVKAIIEDTGIAPSTLELEITESAMMNEPEESAAVLRGLREIGVKVAIDDFGTGYSSLSYLKLLPFTKLKIDQSFVSDIPGDLNDVAITQAIIALGNSLSLEILAEGVETEEQRQFLEREGCTTGQGHVFARALPVDELEAFLRRQKAD